MEHAEVQAAQVREAARASGAFAGVRTLRDLTGRDRMVVARRTDDGGDALGEPGQARDRGRMDP